MLKAAAAAIQFLTPATRAYVALRNFRAQRLPADPAPIAHELVHVMQYERLGGILLPAPVPFRMPHYRLSRSAAGTASDPSLKSRVVTFCVVIPSVARDLANSECVTITDLVRPFACVRDDLPGAAELTPPNQFASYGDPFISPRAAGITRVSFFSMNGLSSGMCGISQRCSAMNRWFIRCHPVEMIETREIHRP